jgi:LuxR family maltose regulon positive regulatory protein
VISNMTISAGNAGESTVDIDPLLAVKLTVPAVPSFVVERGRLLDQLSEAIRNPITVVVGPPGSGKTQLVAAWVSAGAAPGPAIWLTLEEGDDDPAVFWPYLVEGLHQAGVELSPMIEEAARNGTLGRALLARLAADLASRQQCIVLVLDNVSVLANRKLAEDLEALLRHADQHLRMVLVGRWDASLPLYRYRLNGTLSEIRGDDLAFTAAETATLLAGHGVELPERAINALLERTEGWAVGLRLSAMVMEGRDDAEHLVATIVGDDANIAEYFLGEVLAAQSPEVRDFLLRTSIVDHFTPALAEVLIRQGDARHILATLERSNAFVQPVVAHSALHRYHRLFAELLRAQFAYEQPAEAVLLHRRAAAWFAAHGQLAEATRHAVGARDWAQACELLIRDLGVGRLLAGGSADRIGMLFRDMPADTAGPEAAVVLAAKSLAAGRPDEAVELLDRLGPPTDAASAPDRTIPLGLGAAVIGAVAAATRCDGAGALRAAETAEGLVVRAAPDRVAAHPELRTIMRYAKGTAQNFTGALSEAVGTLTDAAGGVLPASGEHLRLGVLEQLSLAYAYQGRLQEAVDTAGRAARLAGQGGQASSPYSCTASAVLAWVAAERWDVASAWRHLRAAETVVAAGDDPMTTVAIALVRSRLLTGRGELQGAARALDEVQRAGRAGRPAWLEQQVAFGRAELDVAMGRPDEALATAAALTKAAPVQAAVLSAGALVARGDARQAGQVIAPVVNGDGADTPLMIEAWLIRAVAAGESRDPGTVRAALGRAIALASTDGHRRAFHQAGPWLRHVLRRDAELAADYRALGTSTASAKSRPVVGSALPTGAPVLVNALSERELQVLSHLAAMLGTEEIADAMYLSVNTVKTHVRSILRKLAASRRNEAVRRARELGIV